MAPCFQSFGSVSSSAIHQPARSLVSSAVAGRGASAPAASATAIVSRAAEWSDSDTRARRGHQKCSRWPLAIARAARSAAAIPKQHGPILFSFASHSAHQMHFVNPAFGSRRIVCEASKKFSESSKAKLWPSSMRTGAPECRNVRMHSITADVSLPAPQPAATPCPGHSRAGAGVRLCVRSMRRRPPGANIFLEFGRPQRPGPREAAKGGGTCTGIS